MLLLPWGWGGGRGGESLAERAGSARVSYVLVIKKGKKQHTPPWETRRGPFPATPQLLSRLGLHEAPSASPGGSELLCCGKLAWRFGDGHMEKLKPSSFHSPHSVQSPKPAGASPPPGRPRVSNYCPQILPPPPHFAASPPTLGSLGLDLVPKTPPKQPSLTQPPTLHQSHARAARRIPPTRGETPENRLNRPEQPLGREQEAKTSFPSPPEPSHPLPPLPQPGPTTWACEDSSGVRGATALVQV